MSIAFVFSLATVNLSFEFLKSTKILKIILKIMAHDSSAVTHLLQNSFLGNIYSDPIIFFHAWKAPWKSFSLMLSSTACDFLWMSDTVSKCHPPVSFSIWETTWKHRGLSLVSREDGELCPFQGCVRWARCHDEGASCVCAIFSVKIW
jgi:hypothetical protein